MSYTRPNQNPLQRKFNNQPGTSYYYKTNSASNNQPVQPNQHNLGSYSKF